MPHADIGVTGLGVMGRSLARNFARHGFTVAVHNRSSEATRLLLADHGDEGTFVACETDRDFVAALTKPRTIVIMVPAGGPTESVIDALVPLLEAGDILVDAGNAHFSDTRRREATLAAHGLHFVGMGVSGGEEGALHGPSIMPGGSQQSYSTLGPILERIAAEVDGVPCCAHVGPDGAGHFAMMVHNGIEYADMQIIGEAYHLLRVGLGLDPAAIGDVFAEWNKGDLESYLIEITAEVLRQKDASTGEALLDAIVDEAGQKGTGRWTVQAALDLGVTATAIAEATFARVVSTQRAQREAAREAFGSDTAPAEIPDRDAFIEDVRLALYASKIVAYAQGFDTIRVASEGYGWGIDLGAMARIWRGGCIISASILGRITEAFERDPGLATLVVDPYFAGEVSAGVASWRRIVAFAVASGIPVPAFGSSLSYYDALRADRLPAALIQGQRDFFGAHSYRRTDREGSFHVQWAGDRAEITP